MFTTTTSEGTAVESGNDMTDTTKHAMKKGQLDTFINTWKCLMADYEDGILPLTLAVKEGHVDAVRDLIELGADAHHEDSDGCTPLEVAAAENNVDMIRALTEGVGANMNSDKGTVFVHIDASRDKQTVIDREQTPQHVMKKDQLDTFINAWKCLMADYEDGFSPLTLAVKEGHVDAVRDLVELGADVNHEDSDGCTPREMAAAHDNVDMIRAMSKRRIPVNNIAAEEGGQVVKSWSCLFNNTKE